MVVTQPRSVGIASYSAAGSENISRHWRLRSSASRPSGPRTRIRVPASLSISASRCSPAGSPASCSLTADGSVQSSGVNR